MTKTEQKIQPVSMMSILSNLRKSFGNDAIFSASDEVLEVAEPISTNSYALDSAIGLGGVPRGRITQLAGAEGSGKTLMALQVIKNWQSRDKKNWCLWIDAETGFNSEWAKTLGVDLDRLSVITENLGSTIFNYLCGIPNTKKPDQKDKEGILDMLIEQGEDNTCGVIVIDSIAAIEPPVEAAYEVGKQNMAAMARFMPQALRRLAPLVNKANVAFIAINQVRVDPSVQYGDPTTTPGGKALKHFCRLMINFAKVNAKDELILNADEEPIGHTIRAKIQKNSFAIPRDTKFAIKYLEGVAFHNIEMVELGIKHGIIQRPNNTMYEYEAQKWRGREAVEQAFLDMKLFNDVWKKVQQARKNGLSIEATLATKEMLGLDTEEKELEGE
jgi:recombination protein RecA